MAQHQQSSPPTAYFLYKSLPNAVSSTQQIEAIVQPQIFIATEESSASLLGSPTTLFVPINPIFQELFQQSQQGGGGAICSLPVPIRAEHALVPLLNFENQFRPVEQVPVALVDQTVNNGSDTRTKEQTQRHPLQKPLTISKELPSDDELEPQIAAEPDPQEPTTSTTADLTPIPQCDKCGLVCDSFLDLIAHNRKCKDKKLFQCSQCAESFNHEINFRLHSAVHTIGKSVTMRCPECDKTFSRLAAFQCHLQLHRVEEVLICEECNDEFGFYSQLQRHKLYVHQLAPPRISYCKLCATVFPNAAKLKIHMAHHRKIRGILRTKKAPAKRKRRDQGKVLECKECKKIFHKWSALLRHQSVHTGSRPFACPQCDAKFTQKGALIYHSARHLPEKPHKCDLCGMRFNQRGNLRNHVLRTHPTSYNEQNAFPCPACCCVFKKVGSLNIHMTRAHPNYFDDNTQQEQQLSVLLTPSNPAASSPGVTAPLGGGVRRARRASKNPEALRNQSSLSDSLKHQARNRERDTESVVQELQALASLANQASLQNQNSQEVTAPVVNHSSNANVAPAVSGVIAVEQPKAIGSEDPNKTQQLSSAVRSTAASSSSNDIQYARITLAQLADSLSNKNPVAKHPVNDNYVGDGMTPGNLKNFSKPLTLHIIDGKRHLQCPADNCGRLFRKPSDLVRHHRIHTNERPYECHLCNRKYKTKHVLTSHIRAHSNTKLAQCGICQKQYVNEGVLKHHMMNVHLAPTPRKCTCQYCKQVFRNKYVLAVHEESCASSVVQSLESLRKQETTAVCDPSLMAKLAQLKKRDLDKAVEKLPEIWLADPVVVDEPSGEPIETRPAPAVAIFDPQKTQPFLNSKGQMVRRFACTHCPLRFKQSIHLKKHMTLHTKERSYKCWMCSRAFAAHETLKIHLARHFGRRNFRCQTCAASFVCQQSLTRHRAVHLDRAPFACPYCNKRFKLGTLCRRHIKSQHKANETIREFLNRVCEKENRVSYFNQDQVQQCHGEIVPMTSCTINCNPSALPSYSGYVPASSCMQATITDPQQTPIGQVPLLYPPEAWPSQGGGVNGGRVSVPAAVCATNNLLQITMPSGINNGLFGSISNSMVVVPQCNIDQVQDYSGSMVSNSSEDHCTMKPMQIVDNRDAADQFDGVATADDSSYSIFDSACLEQFTSVIADMFSDGEDIAATMSNLLPGLAEDGSLRIPVDSCLISPTSCLRATEEVFGSMQQTGQHSSPCVVDQQNFGSEFPQPPQTIVDNYSLEQQQAATGLLQMAHTASQQIDIQIQPMESDGASFLIGGAPSATNQLLTMQPHQCAECNVSFSRHDALKEHIRRTHKRNELFQCDQCDTLFRGKTERSRHVATMHRQGVLHDCPRCGRSFARADSKKRHLEKCTGDPFFGPSGRKLYSRPSAAQRQNALEETGFLHDQQGLGLILKGPAPQSHTEPVRESNDNGKVPGVFGSDGPTMEPPPVELSGDNENVEDENNRQPEIKVVEGMRICPYCPKRFRKPSDLQRHLRIHTGEKPFKCSICSKPFRTTSAVVYHEKTHSNEGPMFSCNVCNQRFAAKCSLRVHMRLHTNERPLNCPHCPENFRIHSQRLHHIRTKHTAGIVQLPVEHWDNHEDSGAEVVHVGVQNPQGSAGTQFVPATPPPPPNHVVPDALVVLEQHASITRQPPNFRQISLHFSETDAGIQVVTEAVFDPEEPTSVARPKPAASSSLLIDVPILESLVQLGFSLTIPLKIGASDVVVELDPKILMESALADANTAAGTASQAAAPTTTMTTSNCPLNKTTTTGTHQTNVDQVKQQQQQMVAQLLSSQQRDDIADMGELKLREKDGYRPLELANNSTVWTRPIKKPLEASLSVSGVISMDQVSQPSIVGPPDPSSTDLVVLVKAIDGGAPKRAQRPKFTCEECNRAFYGRSNLQRHQLVHSNVKQFECPHCDARFKQKRSLDSHWDSRHGGPKPSETAPSGSTTS